MLLHKNKKEKILEASFILILSKLESISFSILDLVDTEYLGKKTFFFFFFSWKELCISARCMSSAEILAE